MTLKLYEKSEFVCATSEVYDNERVTIYARFHIYGRCMYVCIYIYIYMYILNVAYVLNMMYMSYVMYRMYVMYVVRTDIRFSIQDSAWAAILGENLTLCSPRSDQSVFACSR